MARKLIQTINGDHNTCVKIYRDAEWDEYQVDVPGHPAARYHTDSEQDALGTAQLMLGELIVAALASHAPQPSSPKTGTSASNSSERNLS